MYVGFMIGSTTEKKVRSGVHPSIIAASSISSGMDFVKSAEHEHCKTCTKSEVNDDDSLKVYEALYGQLPAYKVNITIWNGTTMENTQNKYNSFVNLLFTLVIYHGIH